jgi:hypothetical protein
MPSGKGAGGGVRQGQKHVIFIGGASDMFRYVNSHPFT